MSQSPENQRLPTSSSSSLRCRICGNAVAIAYAKTDGDGKAVHEECYAAKITSDQARSDRRGNSVRLRNVIAEETSRTPNPAEISPLEELNLPLDTKKLNGTPKEQPGGNGKPRGKS